MKKITLGFLLLTMTVLVSCQKEETPTELANPQQLEFEKLQQTFPGLQRFNSLTDYQNFLKAQQKEGFSAPALKSMIDGDFEIFSDEEEFAATSATLVEDFEDGSSEISISPGAVFEISSMMFADFGGSPEMTLELESDNVNYFGVKVLDITSISGVEYSFDFIDGNGELIYTLSGFSTPPVTINFMGFYSPDKAIKTVRIYSSGLAEGSPALDDIYLGSAVADTDGDGCLDSDDPIVESDMEETVTIQDCNSGIANLVTETCGITMSDQVNELMASAKNHGAFVSSVAKLAKEWEAAGMITKKQKSDLVSCAAHAE
ncbi:MAG: hypothetical protein ABGW97_09685 [Christiangramia sp.]|uniref:hypothetical protein n=1 Tax=Christiangramia sp. TaxID=1931228 RepID=UPI0032428164